MRDRKMLHPRLSLPILSAMLLAIGACGGSDDPAGKEGALATLGLSGGALTLEVRTSPSQPPQVGLSDVEILAYRTADEAPVADLELEVAPWMASMSHGSNVVSAIPSDEPGRYVAQGVSFTMAGPWELRIERKGGEPETATTGAFHVH